MKYMIKSFEGKFNKSPLRERGRRRAGDGEELGWTPRRPIHIRGRSSTLPVPTYCSYLNKTTPGDRRPSRCPSNRTRRPPRPARNS